MRIKRLVRGSIWGYRELCASLIIGFCLISQVAFAQDEPLTGEDRSKAKEMLHNIRDDIREHYFDKKYQGLDFDARFQSAEKKIESASSMNYALADIAGAVSALNDSHTFFIPPPRPYKHSYGWEMQAIGDSGCFVTAVRPGSDAEKKGLKPGDQVLSVNGYSAIREDVRKIRYVFNTLRPQPGLRLVVRSEKGDLRQIDVMASMRATERLRDLMDYWSYAQEERDTERLHHSRFFEYGNDVIIWKLPDFVFDTDQAKKMLDQIRSHKALILDLRGNPGGSVDFLAHFLGGMFDHEVKIDNRVHRDRIKSEVTKTRGDKTFNGKLIVLVDSESASASEIFAKVVQLEKRGIVVGDLSSGSVMESRLYRHTIGRMVMTFYAASVTEADIIMSDGKSLEHIGVVPDVRMTPTAADLAAGRDRALAYAAGLVGIELTPEKAGTLFPVEWPRQ
ncbi:MAG: S41 family peptidase [Candidatus Sulfotelmatobacter sp.]